MATKKIGKIEKFRVNCFVKTSSLKEEIPICFHKRYTFYLANILKMLKLSSLFFGQKFYPNKQTKKAQLIRDKPDELCWEVLPHPAYSPDRTSSYFHRF